MKEIEVKILDIGKTEIIRKLKALGAKKIFEGIVLTSYFDFPSKSLQRSGKILRLRKSRAYATITFKENLSRKRAKTMTEHQIYLDDYIQAQKILEGLGLKEFPQRPKSRTSFKAKDASFEIDKFKSIPAYLEIEAPNLQIIKKYVKLLGFSMKDTKPWSGTDVLKHYKK